VDIHFYSADTTTYRDTIVERVGLTGMYFLPHDFCNSFIDGQEAGAFRCYSDEEVSYVANAGQACGFSVGMEGSLNVQRIGIYPNPSTGLLSIRLPEGPNNAWVQLFNAQGQLAYERSISKGLPLDLSSLHPGIYQVQVILDHDRMIAERWVKE
jgi:hypothetical protein